MSADGVDPRTVRDLVAKINKLEDEIEALRNDMAELRLQEDQR